MNIACAVRRVKNKSVCFARAAAVIACAMITGAPATETSAAAESAAQTVRQFKEFQVPNRPDHVDLLLDVPEGVTASAGYPVTTGVPLADGWLKDTTGLRLETADGRAIPAQFELRGSYPRSRNVRWLGVDFQLAPGATGYRLAFDTKTRPAHPQPIRIQPEGRGYIVTTGGLKAQIEPSGCGLTRVWLKEKLVLEQGDQDGNWFKTLAGVRYADRFEKNIKVVLEREGPLTTTIRVDGRYMSAAGEPACRWTIRYHFHAGQPSIGLTHTFTWIGDPEKLKIKDLGVSFGLKSKATRALVDASAAVAPKPLATPMAEGQRVRLLQDDLFHLGHGKDHFAIYREGAGRNETLAEGGRAGGWAVAGGADGGAAIACRDLWQMYPKELRVEPSRLTALLWSTSGSAPALDLSYGGLEKIWGPPLMAKLGPMRRQYDAAKARATQSNVPTGMARTHDLLLVFGPDVEIAKTAEAFTHQPLVHVDPRVVYLSDVFGPMAPRDAKRFPEPEAWLDGVWDTVFKLVDDWGDYGFIYWGNGPHYQYSFANGRAIADLNRYNAQLPTEAMGVMAWRGYLRSADRRYFEFASAQTRYVNDVVFSHEDTPLRIKGTVIFSPPTPELLPWTSHPEAETRNLCALGSLGFFIEHAANHYYVTGDLRTREVLAEYAETFKRLLDGKSATWNQFVRTLNDNHSNLMRAVFQKFDEGATLYLLTGDERFLQIAASVGERLLDLKNPTGLAANVEAGAESKGLNPYPTYVFYKCRALANYLQALDGRERDRVREVLARTAEYVHRAQNTESRGIGMHMAYAGRLLGDAYPAHAVRALREANWSLVEPPLHQFKYRTRWSGYAAPAWSFWGWPYVLGSLKPDQLSPPSPLLLKQLPWPAVEFVFVKEAGKPLTIELSASAATFTGPDGRSMPEAWMGQAITYHAHNDGFAMLNSDLPLHYRTITVPANVPAGEVRIRVDRAGVAYVFSTSATRAVMIAPDGFHVGGGVQGSPAGIHVGGGQDDRWHFLVPQNATRFRIASSGVERTTIRNPQGIVTQPKPLAAGSYEIAVPRDAAGKLWSVSATTSVDVRFADIQPVFAHPNANAYFTPTGVQIRADLPPAAQTGRTQPPPPPHGTSPRRPQ